MSRPNYELRGEVKTYDIYRDGQPTEFQYVKLSPSKHEIRTADGKHRFPSTGVGEIWAAIPDIRNWMRVAPAPRVLPSEASIKDGRLVVSIGLAELEGILTALGPSYARVSVADIADFIANPDDRENGGCKPITAAVMEAAKLAKDWDDHNEATTEPSSEFMR